MVEFGWDLGECTSCKRRIKLERMEPRLRRHTSTLSFSEGGGLCGGWVKVDEDKLRRHLDGSEEYVRKHADLGRASDREMVRLLQAHGRLQDMPAPPLGAGETIPWTLPDDLAAKLAAEGPPWQPLDEPKVQHHEYKKVVDALAMELKNRPPRVRLEDAMPPLVQKAVIEKGDEFARAVLKLAPESARAGALWAYADDPDKKNYDGLQVMRQLAFGTICQDLAQRGLD